jgi:secretion/DNA translocation related CpaE-like protein
MAGGGASGGGVLVVTADPELLEEVSRLAAAAGTEVHVATEPAGSVAAWAAACVVVVGGASAAAVAAAGLPRRRDVVVVDLVPDESLWRAAVAAGADEVMTLPEDDDRLVALLAGAGAAPSREGVVIGVVGGRGGAGASVLAASSALAATRAGARVLLVDADPLGGGLDLVLGAEDAEGLRWPDLRQARGRVSAEALEAALPRPQALTVLSWDRGDVVTLPVEPVRAVIEAGRRGFDLVVVDLPRRPDEAGALVLGEAAACWLVVPREVRAVAAACRTAALLRPLTAGLAIVTRGPAPTGLGPEDAAEAVGAPFLLDLPVEKGLAAALDRGEPMRRRGPLARAAAALVAPWLPASEAS